MDDFKVGDRVVVIQDYPDDNSKITSGMEGTIVHILDPLWIGIAFDDNVDGHNCKTTCEDGYGWYVRPIEIALAEVSKEGETKVMRKARKLWNNSNWVKRHPEFAY